MEKLALPRVRVRAPAARAKPRTRAPAQPPPETFRQAVISGAKMQVPFSIMGMAMDRFAGGGGPPAQAAQFALPSEVPGYMPARTGLDPNMALRPLPPMPAYMMPRAEADPERVLAFEYGVERFCKEAGFDDEDRAAMFQLLKQGGVAKLTSKLAPKLFTSKWFSSLPGRAWRGAKPMAGQVGGMMGADYLFGKMFGGGAAEPAPQAQVPGYGQMPLTVTSPIERPAGYHGGMYRRASDDGIKEAGVAGKLLGKGLVAGGRTLGAAGRVAGKVGLKSLGKAVPFLGAGWSLWDAANNAMKGNWAAAGMNVLGGAASFIPYAGIPLAVGADLYAQSLEKPEPGEPGKPAGAAAAAMKSPVPGGGAGGTSGLGGFYETEFGKTNKRNDELLDMARKNVLAATTPRGRQEAMEALRNMGAKSRENQNLMIDMMAQERGVFSSSPAERRTMMRRMRSELGPLGNIAMERWKSQMPGGGVDDQLGRGPRRWAGGTHKMTPPGGGAPGAATAGAPQQPPPTFDSTPPMPPPQPIVPGTSEPPTAPDAVNPGGEAPPTFESSKPPTDVAFDTRKPLRPSLPGT